MKPHVICHMVSSLDGRIWSSRWRPSGTPASKLFEPLHDQLAGDAWLIGRVTGREFAKRESYPADGDARFPREPWLARRDAKAWGIVLDAHGKIAWGRADIGGDPIVVVLTERVSDAHLAGLRGEGVSYLFAGTDALDLRLALETINRELGVTRLLLEGGGITNGEFLRAGLVDEISLVIAPAIDGAQGGPHLYNSRDATSGPPPLRAMTLDQCQVMAGGGVWLRYTLDNG
jgi:riboflavin biosynthesis pyrimidine reductase